MNSRGTTVFVFVCAIVLAAIPAKSATQCGPFGNPPVTLLADPVPSCGQFNLGDFKGKLLGPWPDSDGTARYACVYQPAAASTAAPLPLVVFIHPSLATADVVYEATNLNFYLSSANVSGNPAHPGFIMLAPEGRNTTHYYQAPDQQGPGWDNWYRQFDPSGDVTVGGVLYKENVDAAAIDHFISQVASTGIVDQSRIYITGWSNGASMGFIYGLNRPKVAAVAVYSGPDPYGFNVDPCPQTPVTQAPANNQQIEIFNPGIAIYHVHNDCDIAGLCPNAEFFRSEIASLEVLADDQIIDTLTLPESACNALCGSNPNGDGTSLLADILGTLNHLRWPFNWTASMLDFFRQHPLP